MRQYLVTFLLIFSVLSVWAEDVPTLLVLTTQPQTVQIPIASIQKITYDKAGTSMYVYTTSGTQTYAIANVEKMTLQNVPETTALNPLTDSQNYPLTDSPKIMKDGVVYIINNGKVYTLDGGIKQ